MNLNRNKLASKLVSSILAIDESFQLIINQAEHFGEENCFLAGGIVRDFFLDKNLSKDVDVFVTEKLFESLIPAIKKHGELIVNPFGSMRWFPALHQPFYYDIIIIERFYNGLWACENIVDVLNQFDITANALAFDIVSGDFYNPQNGLIHLQKKELRAVRFDYPEIDLSEKIPLSRNSILWFRYKHYSEKLGFTKEQLTAKWVHENSFRAKDKALFMQHFFNPDN